MRTGGWQPHLRSYNRAHGARGRDFGGARWRWIGARQRCRAHLHRTHPYPVDLAADDAAGPSGRADLPDRAVQPWLPALEGLDAFERVEVLYWLHLSRRDLLRQSPADNGVTRGTFALRSPVRPNPIGTSLAKLVGIEGAGAGPGPGLYRRHAAARPQAGPVPVHADRTAAGGGFRNRRLGLSRLAGLKALSLRFSQLLLTWDLLRSKVICRHVAGCVSILVPIRIGG